MKSNVTIRWIIVILSIVFGGFLLFNLGFIALAILINSISMQGGNNEFNLLNALFMFLAYLGVTLVLIYALKALLDKEDFKTAVLATLLTLPLMAMLVYIGIVLFENELMILLVSLAVMIPILLWMILRKAHPWYLISWCVVMIAGAAIHFFNIQI